MTDNTMAKRTKGQTTIKSTSDSASSLGIQYTFKALKITYCCMRGYLQKYLHKFHKVK